MFRLLQGTEDFLAEGHQYNRGQQAGRHRQRAARNQKRKQSVNGGIHHRNAHTAQQKKSDGPRRELKPSDQRKTKCKRAETGGENKKQRADDTAKQSCEINAISGMACHQLVANGALSVLLSQMQAAEHGAEQIDQQKYIEQLAVQSLPIAERLLPRRNKKNTHKPDDSCRRQSEKFGAQEAEQLR